MKKLVFSSMVLFICANAFAQSVFNTNGSVNLATNSNANLKVSVGPVITPSSNTNYGLYSSLSNFSTSLNVGILGSAFKSSFSSSNLGIGILGTSGGQGSQYNFGVFGTISNCSKGAAVYGIASSGSQQFPSVPAIQGVYAGYFSGPTYIDGSLTVTETFTHSDIRLKENIEPLVDYSRGESTVEDIMKINVLKYNFIDNGESEGIADISELTGINEEEAANENTSAGVKDKKLHFGVSAQELQEIYPNLVEEGQDGYLSVNYTELVPVLIQCIQELKQEINDLRTTGTILPRKTNGGVSHIGDTESNRSYLYQNNPNPTNGQTEIRYSLSPQTKNAYILICDLQGKQLKQIPVSPDSQSIRISSLEFVPGVYLYSLVDNNQVIDTKRMVISK